MDRLLFEGTKMTPSIILDKDAGEFFISGTSRPENPMEFYKPMFEWLEAHFSSNTSKTILKVQLDYFNTSTSKILLDLFELFEAKAEDGQDVHVIWYFEEDDEEMQEAGEELLDLVSISYEVKAKDY